jgi:hypothetical protein
MNIANEIKEYMDFESGRRFVSVSFVEDNRSRQIVIPFDLLSDDLLAFVADAACLYGDEVFHKDGFRALERLILLRKADS